MLRSLTIVSVLTSAVFAQSTSSLIPSGISQPCTTFLMSLNSDTTFASCLSSMQTATSAFAPGSSTATSSASVTAALTSLCSSSVTAACPESFIRSKLTDFFTACPAELTTTPNAAVITMYDALYGMSPMTTAACSKGDDDSWCAMADTTTTREVSDDVAGSSSNLGLPQLLALLYTDNSALKRRADTPAIVPNMTTYHNSNLPFLFLTPGLDASKLCTTCARNVMTAYINFESNIPYAAGISKSPLLSSQTDLYNEIQQKCPAGFLSGAVQAAGGLSSSSDGIFKSAAVSVSPAYKNLLSITIGVATLAVSFAL